MKKNSYAKPFTTWTGRLVYGEGVDKQFDLLQTAIDLEIIVKKGNQHIFAGIELGVGRARASTKLSEDKELSAKVREAVLGAP